jgi:hypothetical protein
MWRGRHAAAGRVLIDLQQPDWKEHRRCRFVPSRRMKRRLIPVDRDRRGDVPNHPHRPSHASTEAARPSRQRSSGQTTAGARGPRLQPESRSRVRSDRRESSRATTRRARGGHGPTEIAATAADRHRDPAAPARSGERLSSPSGRLQLGVRRFGVLAGFLAAMALAATAIGHPRRSSTRPRRTREIALHRSRGGFGPPLGAWLDWLRDHAGRCLRGLRQVEDPELGWTSSSWASSTTRRSTTRGT